MYIEEDAFSAGLQNIEEITASTYRSSYRVEAPTVVALIQGWEQRMAKFHEERKALGHALGGEASTMRWFQAYFVGGIRLRGGLELDRHWRLPDTWGYRQLRAKPRFPKGMRVVTPAMIEAEHNRLKALWATYCPAQIDAAEVWRALGVHTGSVALWGGLFFSRGHTAYIALGFRHDRQAESKVSERGPAHVPWLESATPTDLDEVRGAWAAL